MLDEQTSTIEARSIEIDTTPDATGAALTLVVNGCRCSLVVCNGGDTSDSE
ncbi:MAG: hypothetical protein R2713_00520 [Ilumatobacteraceae bacterium]